MEGPVIPWADSQCEKKPWEVEGLSCVAAVLLRSMVLLRLAYELLGLVVVLRLECLGVVSSACGTP